MSALLRLESLTKRFGGLTALGNVSLELAEGEILGLIGPNGAGKTTLFNIVSGRMAPSAGRVFFDGQEITGLAPHLCCRLGLARTFQIARPFAKLSLVDNVMVGAFLREPGAAAARARAHEVLDFVGLAAQAAQPAATLTTSGRKRLELARALATGPRLLLLDEVMAGLTPTESVAIVGLIGKIRDGGVSLLVIEHVMKAIMRLSDRVAVLHHGELIAAAEPAAIARDPQVIEAYLGEEFELAGD